MTIPETELRTAIYDRLQATGYPVFWSVPLEQSGVYYVLGDINCLPDNTKSGLGFEVHAIIHVWDERRSSPGDRGAGEVELLKDAAVDAITTAFHSSPNYLTLSSFYVIRQDLESAQTFADGAEMPHGVLEFQFLVQNK